MTANIDVLVEKKSDYPALPAHVTVTTPIFFFFWPDFHSVNNSEFPYKQTLTWKTEFL